MLAQRLQCTVVDDEKNGDRGEPWDVRVKREKRKRAETHHNMCESMTPQSEKRSKRPKGVNREILP